MSSRALLLKKADGAASAGARYQVQSNSELVVRSNSELLLVHVPLTFRTRGRVSHFFKLYLLENNWEGNLQTFFQKARCCISWCRLESKYKFTENIKKIFGSSVDNDPRGERSRPIMMWKLPSSLCYCSGSGSAPLFSITCWESKSRIESERIKFGSKQKGPSP